MSSLIEGLAVAVNAIMGIQGRVFFNKPKLLKELLKSWPHSEMQ